MINKFCFFRFPLNDEKCRKWVNAVRRKNWKPSKTSRICSAHFREEDINRTLCTATIREGAFPAIFTAFPEELKVNDRRPSTSKIQVEVQSTSESLTKRLKTEVSKKKSYLVTCKTKIKVLHQKKRRVTKRVENLEFFLDDLEEKQNFQ